MGYKRKLPNVRRSKCGFVDMLGDPCEKQANWPDGRCRLHTAYLGHLRMSEREDSWWNGEAKKLRKQAWAAWEKFMRSQIK